MAVFRVEKTKDYTIMSNHHLKNKSLSLKAKGLLSLMLSLPEIWDYTLKGLTFLSSDGIDAIREAVKELEKAGYIVRKRARNEKGQLGASEYVIYEQPQPVPDKPTLEKPILDNPTLDNPMQEKPTLENPTQLNIDKTNTKKSNTYSSMTDQSNPNQSCGGGFSGDAGFDAMGYDEARESVKENIEYEIAVQKLDKPMLDEIVDIMTETLCSRKAEIVVAGNEYPARLVKDRLLKLDESHVEYVIDCIKDNTTKVHNIKKYLLAALFNAPATIDSYYQTRVNHDLYGQK